MAVAVVTGASKGIGRSIALALAQAGSDVVGVSRDGDSLDEVGAAARATGVRYLAIPVDLASPDGPGEAAERAWHWQGGVVTLVNAAGLIIRDPGDDELVDAWDATIALNARAPFILMERLGSQMAGQGHGSIVNVASIAGQVVTRAPATYQASKAALVQLTRYYSVALAPNVRVNAVGPGYIRTDLTSPWLADPMNEDYVRQRTPLGRVGVPEDVAAAVVFLASDGAAYITGQHLLIDGGWTAT